MDTAKLFKSGNSQALRLPKAYRFDVAEVEIFRRGDEVVLRARSTKLSALLAELPPWPDDIGLPDDAPAQPREALG
jgi:antitoxin VapB